MSNDIRDKVKEKYGQIAKNQSSCCGPGSCCGTVTIDTDKLYGPDLMEGLPQEAINASLGCANPVLLANLQPGEVALDLGSGGGIDVLASSRAVLPGGKVYGLDMTDEMLALANANKARMGVENVEFLKGYLEEIPLPDATVDVVMSNCVINLTADKEIALSEAFRVLKPGGRLAIADVVALKPVDQALRQEVELWVGCIAGTLEISEFEAILSKAGFTDIAIETVITYTEASMLLGDKIPAGSPFGREELQGAFASAHIKARKK